jgi:four helix bundle protein
MKDSDGLARHTTGEFVQFISHAEGSAAELNTQILLSIDLGCVAPEIGEPALAPMVERRNTLNALRRCLT